MGNNTPSESVVEELQRWRDRNHEGAALPPALRAALAALAVKVEQAWIEVMSNRLDTEGSIAVIRAAAEAHRRAAEHRVRQIESERDHMATKLKERDLECQALEIALDHATMRLSAAASHAVGEPAEQPATASLLAERESLKDQICSLQAQMGRLAARTLLKSNGSKNNKMVYKRSERESYLEAEIVRLKRRLAQQKEWIEKARRHLGKKYPQEKQDSGLIFR